MSSIAKTQAGSVKGFEEEGAHVFLGVPYAAPPFGEHRFAAPAPVEPWEGTRDALVYGPTAPQKDPVATIIPEPVERGEDILNLNVFTPDLGDARLPVFVWIHGGGFVSGCNRSPWYRGTRFARDGVVVVNIGYRLGVEGFIDLPDAPPNRAVLDWIAGLEWVQENIANFGGDPSQVTIGGQSAGSAACLVLAADPKARGMFNRVTAMSGTSDTRMPLAALTELGEKMAAQLGVRATREDFGRFSPDELIEAHGAVGQNPFTAEALGASFDPRTPALKPAVDGDVIAEHPFRVIANGGTKELDLLAGATANEINGVIHMQVDEEAAALALGAMGLVGEKLDRYMAHTAAANPVAALAQAATDRAFRGNLAQLLEDRAHPGGRRPEGQDRPGGRTFGYEFRRPSPLYDGLPGAAHCLDLPFVWDNLDAEQVEDGLTGPNPPQSLADEMHGAWVRFIKTGDAGWPEYEADRRTVMVFEEPSELIDDHFKVERELFGRSGGSGGPPPGR
jgi:para-nitrobenzyl esterase